MAVGRLSAPRGGQLLTSTAFAFLVLFVFAIPLENALVLPGVGTFGRLVGLAAFAVGIFAVIEKGHAAIAVARASRDAGLRDLGEFDVLLDDVSGRLGRRGSQLHPVPGHGVANLGISPAASPAG